MPSSNRPAPARRRRAALLLAGAACAGAGVAQQAQAQDSVPPNTGIVVTPTLSADESFYETRSRADGSNGRESVTRLSPGLRLSSRSGSLRGALDYAGSLVLRSGRSESEGHEFQNSLNAAFVVEAVTGRLYVDTRATISQQSISAFGQQSVEGSLQRNDNRTEVTTVNVSPYLRGNLGSAAAYELRLNAATTNSRDAAGSDSKNAGASLLVQSTRGGSMFGWALNASRQRVAYSGVTDNTVDNGRVDATLTLTPDPTVRLSASGGRESTDQSNGSEHRSDTTGGLGLQWTPSPRTSLGIDVAERYFGRSSRIAFSHRRARSVLTYSFTRDVSQGADAFNLAAPRTLYQLLDEAAQASVPDPVLREQVVLAQLAGRDPNELVALGFLTSTLSLQRRQDLGFSWLGQRTTLSVQAFTNTQRQLISIIGADTITAEPVRLHGYSSTVSYRLTPQTTVTAAGSRQMTFGTSTQAGNDLKSANLSLSSQLGRTATALLGARYTVFNSATDPYRETAVTASLSLRY